MRTEGRARELLDTTTRSVSSIAQELRFCSAQHLDRIFKRTTGATPSACRRKGAAG
ncbi:MAG: helix-turn-helix domain-containing protein [Kiritimatiellia bacterium]